MIILGNIFLIVMGILTIVLILCVISVFIFFLSELIRERIKDNRNR